LRQKLFVKLYLHQSGDAVKVNYDVLKSAIVFGDVPHKAGLICDYDNGFHGYAPFSIFDVIHRFASFIVVNAGPESYRPSTL
jgi:hypothetical protein